MKKYILSLVLLCALVINVNAVSSNERVYADLTEYSCSAFQEDSKVITGDTYFGRCMEARCNNSKWNLKYYENQTVTCKNGNLNPYIKITKDGCNDYRGNTCRGSSIKYCTTITYFDCDRTTNGTKFTTTTTKTTKPTTRPTTGTTRPTQPTKPTDPVKDNNIYLSSIELSTGSIEFNKETRYYSISVENNISYIIVTAKPEVATSKVGVSGNTNLVVGENKIDITVTAEDGSVGLYTIIVNKGEKISNNASLKDIKINGKSLKDFNSAKYNYIYETKDNKLNIEVETVEDGAVFELVGAENIKDNTEIKINVIAPDGVSTQDYIITINLSNNSSTIISVIFISILVVLVGGGIYYFYTRKKNGGEKEYEYE